MLNCNHIYSFYKKYIKTLIQIVFWMNEGCIKLVQGTRQIADGKTNVGENINKKEGLDLIL